MDSSNSYISNNNIKTFYYNKKISILSIIYLIINIITFIVLKINGMFLFNTDGIVLDYSCNMVMDIFGVSILLSIILAVIITDHSRVKKGITHDPKIVLDNKSYKPLKIIISIAELLILLSFFLSVKFHSHFVLYKNGFLTTNDNTATSKIKVSDIKYFSVYGRKHRYSQPKGRGYDYLGVSITYYYNGTSKTLADCTNEKELSKIDTFLEDIKRNYNFQGVSVSLNELNEVNGEYHYNIIQNKKAPVFYIKTFPSLLSDIEDTSMTDESEKFLNEPCNTINYSNYIKGNK